MGKIRLKSGFKTQKQLKRLRSISEGAKLRFYKEPGAGADDDHKSSSPVITDHSYAVRVAGGDGQEEISSWRHGRRVVELGVLADGLSACKKCHQPLHLLNTTSINTYGLSAILKVQCTSCQFMNNIPTGKQHGRIWDANTKLASAMINAGVGGRQINSILTSLNIPPVSEPTLRSRQKEIGPVIELVAEDSIENSIAEEIRLTEENSGDGRLTVSVDGAWQKRGSGRSFDSLSGHCSMIGAQTGKVVGYSVRSKFCKMCDVSSKQGQVSKSHDCRCNWDGSSKSMESDMVIEMVTKHHKAGHEISTIIADDDTTTFQRLNKSLQTDFTKKSDCNHVRKNITSQLYKLQVKHKSLTSKVIKYIQKCINYMLSQNQGNSKGISKGFDVIIKHVFGNHSECDPNWCSHRENPNKKYRALPYGQQLKDQGLQSSLTALFDTLKHQSDKLSTLGSTQGNESFNKTVASKAPKAHFYSGTASLNHRVAASVAHKNIGHSYVTNTHRQVGLSPGGHTFKLACLRDLQARKRKACSITRKAKIRRLELHARRIQANTTKEIREGTSYSSCIDTTDIPVDSIQEIPNPEPLPSLNTSPIPQKSKQVYFDLESTGLARTSHITQVAAVCEDDKFSTYVTPGTAISPAASSVTGLTCRNGKLFKGGHLIDSVSVSKALEDLIAFLKQYPPPLYLVGHNIKTFDCPLLMNALESVGKQEEFLGCVSGFLDTKILFRTGMPGLKSYSQPNLVKHVTGSSDYNAHDALADVLSLQTLVLESKLNVFDSAYENATFSTEYVKEMHRYSKRVRANLPSLQPLIDRKILSESMARKVAGSGLNCSCLALAYRRNGVDGIRKVFGEKCGMKGVRVTKSSKIVSTVGDYFSQLQICVSEM